MFCPKCGCKNLDSSKFCRKCGRQLPVRLSGSFSGYSGSALSAFVGQTIDVKYRLETILGSGGMGDVYRATRLLSGDRVAIKVLHPHLARDAMAAERFRREAVMATRLQHRNIVGIYDVGYWAAQNTPYILMELAEGYTLRQILNHYKIIPLDFAVTVTAQICAALTKAHELGIVHRDIKPENILANETKTGWTIKVLDFGIAKVFGQVENGLTLDGSSMGTPHYMSPEQCLGEVLDARSDIYSVGVLLFEMLCGSSPFRSAVPSAVAVQQVNSQPPDPLTLNPGLHPAVVEVMLRSLEKSPSKRQRSASQLAGELIEAATVAIREGAKFPPVKAPNVVPAYNADPYSSSQQVPLRHDANDPPVGFEASGTETLVKSTHVPVCDDVNQAAEAVGDIEEPTETAFQDGKITDAHDVPIKTGGLEDESKGQWTIGSSSQGPSDTSIGIDIPQNRRDRAEGTGLPFVVSSGEPLSVQQIRDGESVEASSKEHINETETGEIENADVQDLTAVVEEVESKLDSLISELQLSDAENEIPEREASNREDGSLDEAPDVQKHDSANGDPLGSASDGHGLPLDTNTSGSVVSHRKIYLVAGVLLPMFAVLGLGLGIYHLTGTPDGRGSAKMPSSDRNIDTVPEGMVRVEGRSFQMGSASGDEYSRPPHTVEVSTFFIDIYEVTNEKYLKFVEATGHRYPPHWKGGKFSKDEGSFPVTNVNWEDAKAYCEWVGGRLPAEAEWEYAARGTSESLYPWGDGWDHKLANAGGTKGPRSVGQGGRSPFGLYDMSGNVWEWTSTDANAYPGGKEFRGLKGKIKPKIMRGGSWESRPEEASAIYRIAWGIRNEPSGYKYSGFRCARDVPN